MKTKQIIKFSLILSLFSIFIFSFTYFGASAFASLTATKQSVSENKKIKTIDSANKTAQETKFARPEIITAATIKLEGENHEFKKFVEVVPVIEFGAKTKFSFSQLVRDNGLVDLSPSTYNQIASVVYMAVLNTNFTIFERHISTSIPDSITPGFEAKVDFGENIDLQLYNPNENDYRIEFNWTSSELQVAIKGVPLLYDYSIKIADTEKFEPRTIKQYSPLLKQGQISVEKEGEAGLLVTVNREIYTTDGKLLETELLSEDFYPPVNRIEILAVPPATQPTTPSLNTVADAVTPPAELEPEPGSSPATPEPGDQDGNDPAANGSGEADQDLAEDSDEMWGKPNETPK